MDTDARLRPRDVASEVHGSTTTGQVITDHEQAIDTSCCRSLEDRGAIAIEGLVHEVCVRINQPT